MRDEGYNPTAVLSWMKSKGFIVADVGRNDKKKRFGSANPRCIWIKQSILDTFIDEIEEIDENSDEAEKNPFLQEKLEIDG